MPFVRFSRDRRGYEYVYLVDVPGRQQRSARPRVLYWYRSPPGLKIGRPAFDQAVRVALETQHPDLKFDWKQIVETPMPPPEVVPAWRERRRQERAAKKLRLDEAAAPAPDIEAASEDGPTPPVPAPDGAPAEGPAAPRRRRRRRGGRPAS